MKDINDLEAWADLIERFLEGQNIGRYEWDDYLNLSSKSPLINAVQEVCSAVYFLYHEEGQYCDTEGAAVLRDLAKNLKAGPQITKHWLKNFGEKHQRTFPDI